MAQVTKVQQEMDFVDVVPGSAEYEVPVLEALNQDVDLQQLPMMTVQQLHNSIQPSFRVY